MRIAHWINAVCLTILLLSGLQIFNAHPALYFGLRSHFEAPSLEVKAVTAADLASGAALKSSQSLAVAGQAQQAPGSDSVVSDDGGQQTTAADRGVVTAFGRAFDTTGWLGYTYGPEGQIAERDFPSWLTLPGEQNLAAARRWHFTFAWLLVLNGLIYLSFTVASGHFHRDLWATAREWRGIPHSIWQHVRLRFPKGEAALRYNVLQKLTYLVVIFVLLPVMILAGMAMSPGLNARFPLLLTLFGGRQTARTIHFILAFGLVGFVFVHILMVMLSGFFNNMRSMITGRYVIPPRGGDINARS